MKHFIPSLSVLCANTPPYEGSIASHKILTLLLILFLGVGNAWAEDVTFSWSGSATADAGKTDYVVEQTPVTLTFAAGTAQNAPRTNKEGSVRMYANTTLTISCASGNITKVTFTPTNTSYNATKLKYNGTALTSDEWTLSSPSNEVTLTASANARFKTIVVTYTSAGSGETPEPDPDPTPDPEPEPDPDPAPGTGGTGTINFNSSAVKINAASVTGNDDLGNTWTITTVGTTSYTASNAYYQVGSGSKPATSITFTTTLPSDVNVTAFSAKFGGFNSTAGAVTLKVDDTSVGTGSLNATSDVTISNSSQATGKKLTVTLTGIAKGVKVYYISYTYTTSSGGGEQEPVIVKTLKSIAVTGMTTTFEQGDVFKFDGTCTATYSVTKDGVAQDDETAEVTPTSVLTPDMDQIGTPTITVTYETVSTTYDITITENEVTAGTYNVLLNNELWNVTAGQQTASVESMTGKANDITFYTTKGSSQMYASTTQTRFYKDATFVISVPTGYVIKSIKFTEPTSDKKWEGSISASVGTYDDGTKSWSGNAQEVIFSFAGQNRIANASITFEAIDLTLPSAPTFNPEAGTYNAVQNVTISAEAGTTIYYTLGGIDPTTESNIYASAIEISETTTVKAIAVKDEKVSPIASAKYTINLPLTTMDQIFAKATAVGGTATPVHVTMNNWVVTGVKNNNVYVTDGTKGLIIYTASHGFNVGDILSGTVACKVQLYNGSAELTELTNTTEGLTVTTDGVVTPVEVTDITTLGGVNTGSVIKITGPCTLEGTKYYVAGVQLYNSLYTYTNPEDGYNYECTGVYLQFNTTKEILPRKAEDLVKIETQQPAGIKFETTEYTANVNEAFTAPTLTNPNDLTVAYSTSDATLATVDATTGAVTILDKAGKVTITASFAGDDDYVAGSASYTINITDPSVSEATFVAGTDKSEELTITKNGVTVEFTGGTFSRDDNYRCYSGQKMTISYADGNITKIVLECTTNNDAKYGPSCFETETASYSYFGKVGTWTGEAKSITFNAKDQVRMTAITVYYKQDTRTPAGLAWNPATISLTVGDAFTAPTFSKPNSVTGITFASDNEALATVNNTGSISLVSGKTGTATITATYAGNETYKPAEVTCVITVSPKSEKVVILAEYNGQWYAMTGAYVSGKTNVLSAISVEYINGTLYNVAEADKASIEWQRSMNGNKAIFKNGDNYLTGGTSTNLTLETTEFEWDYNGVNYLCNDGKRTFLYCENTKTNVFGFKNYAISNAGSVKSNSDGTTESYSSTPVVTTPIYKTATFYTRSELTEGNYGTICLPYASDNFTGATFFEVAGKEGNKIVFDEVAALEAGKPYIFLAEATEIKVAQIGTAELTAQRHNSLQGTFTQINPATDNELVDNYMVVNNVIKKCGVNCGLQANRAYFVATELENLGTAPAPAPSVRRISMGVTGQNTATGVDQVQGDEVPTKMIINGQLFILRGEKTYDAQGKLVK
ncbi:MAG: chitobiase/beta-hexosaminidase C-terminal domain-containing protein [Paludibacteraceae bacterium]|nr:chitobiase/beta-hexosaminidase C-terminal domain-containing protein [Paludibacteraceae bacterium]